MLVALFFGVVGETGMVQFSVGSCLLTIFTTTTSVVVLAVGTYADDFQGIEKITDVGNQALLFLFGNMF